MSRRTVGLDELRTALAAAGYEPIESVDARLEALEAGLMRSIDDDGDFRAVVVPIGHAYRRRVSKRLVGAVAGVACIVAVVVFAAGWFRSADPDVVISSADGVSVVLPDGSIVEGVQGLELPDGAQLEVEGSLVVGDERFGPGDYIVGPDGVITVPSAGGTAVAETTTTTTTTTSTTTVATGPVAVDITPEPGGARPAGTAVPDGDAPVRPTTSRPADPPPTRPPPTRLPATLPPATRPPPTQPPVTTVPARPSTTVQRQTTTSSTMFARSAAPGRDAGVLPARDD